MAAVKKLNPKAEVARAAQALDLNISGKERIILRFYHYFQLFNTPLLQLLWDFKMS